MSDKNPSPWSRRAGRGLRRLLGKLFGERGVRRTGESIDVLKREFAAGREEGDPDGAGDGDVSGDAKSVPHRELEGDRGAEN